MATTFVKSQIEWDIEEKQAQAEIRRLQDKQKGLMTSLKKRYEGQSEEMAAKVLAQVEPVLRVILMDPDKRINGMHAEISLRWSSVYVRDDKPVFRCNDGTEYCLGRSRLARYLYLGHPIHQDDTDGDVFD